MLVNRLFRLFRKRSSSSRIADKIKELFGFTPADIELFQTAFRHKSLYEKNTENNERLEFLGDAVLDAAVADYLFQRYSDKSEGFLTKMKSKIVSRSRLNDLAQAMEITEMVEARIQRNKSSTSLGGNALEAIIGAVYVEKGYPETLEIIRREILEKHIDIEQIRNLDFDPKSRLIECCHKHKKSIEFITGIAESGGREEVFVSRVLIDGEEAGKSDGASKKKAEKAAAALVLKTHFQNN